MKIRVRAMTAIAVAIISVMFFSCRNNDEPKYRVAILKLGSHPLIDEVESNVVAGLTEKYHRSAKISVYNGNFEPDLLKQAVDQIVVGKFDVAIPITTPATAALVNAAKPDLNIVFSFVSNPETIWGQDKQTPSNVTGTSDQIDYQKNLKLIHDLFPKATRIGYLVNQAEPNAQAGLKLVRELAPKFGFSLVTGSVGSPADVTEAANTIVGNVDVFLVGGDNTVVSGLGGLLSVADHGHIPVFAVEKTSVEKGCIAAYGVDYADLGRKTFDLVDQVLQGKKPNTIPILYYRDTKLYVNKTALRSFQLAMPADTYKAY